MRTSIRYGQTSAILHLAIASTAQQAGYVSSPLWDFMQSSLLVHHTVLIKEYIFLNNAPFPCRCARCFTAPSSNSDLERADTPRWEVRPGKYLSLATLSRSEARLLRAPSHRRPSMSLTYPAVPLSAQVPLGLT
jgi:hypothetical protein